MDVERISLAVLGELRAGNPVTAAAIKRGEIHNGFERRAKINRARRHLFAHPMRDGLGHAAAKIGRGETATRLRSRSTTASSRTTSGASHAPGPVIGGNEGAIATSGVRRSRQADGCGGSEKFGISGAGRGRGKGMLRAVARSQATNSSNI